jgi:hypothetical protein
MKRLPKVAPEIASPAPLTIAGVLNFEGVKGALIPAMPAGYTVLIP